MSSWSHSHIGARIPDGWHQRDSLTLSHPDGRANLICSSEETDEATSTTSAYASAQDSELRSRFPGFVQHSFGPDRVFGGHDGFRRVFSWTPDDGPQVTQMQLYLVLAGRSYTATATATAEDFDELSPLLEEMLLDLQIYDPTVVDAAAPATVATELVARARA